jgi:hypothetical protein
MLSEKALVRNLARKIDTRDVRNHIASTHDTLRGQYAGRTLMQCYATGYTWNREKSNLFFERYDSQIDFFMRSWQYDNERRTLEETFPGFYNRIEIQNAWIRAQFIQRMCKLDQFRGAIIDNEVNMDLLIRLSAESASTACQTYPIKCFLVGNMYEESHLYHGIQPGTKPVKNCFVGTPYQDQISQSHITSMLAYELEESPLFVNTGLWWIGAN